MKKFSRKWWIDRDGNDILCLHGTKEVPDDLHWGKAEELWRCTTEACLKMGLIRVVRYDNEIFYQAKGQLNRKQLRTLKDLSIEENCYLHRDCS